MSDVRRTRRPTSRSALFLLVGLGLLIPCPMGAVAAPPCEQDPDPDPEPDARERAAARQRKLQATFLKHFAQLVRWPAEAFEDEETPFVLGVVGTDPLRRELDEVMADLEIDGRPVRVRRFGSFESLEEPEELASCQLLLVAEAEPIVQGRIISLLEDAPTLLVSNALGFADAGGGIQTFVVENRTRFEVNRRALKGVGLRPSSKLLTLSRPAPARPKPSEGRGERRAARMVGGR